jgi:hypothetical protein
MTNEQPQPPTLEHVATTLQFCQEQLLLCEKVVCAHNRWIVADYIADAVKATSRSVEMLRETGHAPESLSLEVPGYEARNVVVT